MNKIIIIVLIKLTIKMEILNLESVQWDRHLCITNGLQNPFSKSFGKVYYKSYNIYSFWSSNSISWVKSEGNNHEYRIMKNHNLLFSLGMETIST
jgi:hypothetical protein